MISRLNQAGRDYMKSDRCNVVKGVDVLGKVSDNLDCLFFHLCASPVLCIREQPVDPQVRNKRKAAASNDQRPPARQRCS